MNTRLGAQADRAILAEVSAKEALAAAQKEVADEYGKYKQQQGKSKA
jgi:hypothetical protein